LARGRQGTLVEAYRKLNPPPFLIIGFIDDDPAKKSKILSWALPCLGDSEHLLDIVEDYRISDVVVAITGEIKGETFQTILDTQERGVEVTRMPIMYEELTQRVPIEHSKRTG
jgi:FlaA1/EpsC-like NDP-sugar epimerase